MKVRKGFVSNSSSCSFLIYGINIENEEFDADEILQPEFKKEYVEKNECYSDSEKYTFVGLSDYLYDYTSKDIPSSKREKILVDIVLRGYQPSEYYPVYIGRSYDTIEDGETGAEFKENTKEALRQIFTDEFLEKCDFGIYSEAWHD